VTLADFSIKNPVFAWMLMAFLVIFGAISFSRLGVSQTPDIDFPTVSVSVSWEGASPEIMESDVVDILEDAVMAVEGIKEVTSSCRSGNANVTMEFELNRNIDAAVQDVQTKLAQAARLLPRDIDPPIVSKNNPEDNPILWVALSGQASLQQLSITARDFVKDRFQTVKGVGEVMMGGYLDRNMRVWLKREELEARQLTVDDVLEALRREHIEVPAGRIETADREMSVRSEGEAPSVAEFQKIVVAYRNNAPVFLEQVALIEDGLADKRRVARAMGAPAIGLGIKKQRGSNAVEVARGVKARMKEIQGSLPPGMELAVNFDSTTFIEDSIHEIEFTLLLSVILTALVCWLFLGSWSSTFNILLSIPTSIVGAFIVIYAFNFTLNTFTLLGLSLAIGIVVDDAIMVLENIYRHREKGTGRVAAASRGAREITGAAIAASVAIMAVFLPIAFMKGIIGKFLFQFGVTITVAVALSLIEAITLTPMRASQMLSAEKRETGFGGFLSRFFRGLARLYGRSLAWALRWRAVVLLVSMAGFGGSLWLTKSLKQELVPAQDQSRFLVRIQAPAGSSIDYTDGRFRQCEEFLATMPEVDRFFGSLGGFGGGEVDTGNLFITLIPRQKRRPQVQVINDVRAKFNSVPGIRAIPNDLSMSGLGMRGNAFPIEFVVTGADWEQLAASTQKILEKMKESGLTAAENSNYIVGLPELRIVPDRQRAADLGVSMSALGNTISANIGGVRAARFKDGARRFDVRVRLVKSERDTPEDVGRLFVRNREGKLVQLSELVRVKEQPVVQTITRRNRQRAITITANVAGGKSQQEATARCLAIAQEVLPPGYVAELSGSSRLFSEAKWELMFALGLGILIAYMVLASQFNSYVHPALVLLAMPFSLTGAILGLLIAGASLNMYSMIGVILLMGIVKKNSILLVEFTNHVRAQGRPVREALLEACPIRLRPILMTSLSTVAAAIPPALALGPGAETRIPMAVVVIGGVILSTFLTLYVVPCAYSLVPGRVRNESEVEAEMADQVPAKVG